MVMSAERKRTLIIVVSFLSNLQVIFQANKATFYSVICHSRLETRGYAHITLKREITQTVRNHAIAKTVTIKPEMAQTHLLLEQQFRRSQTMVEHPFTSS